MEDLSHHPRRLMVHKLFRIFLEVRVKSSELDGQGVKKAFLAFSGQKVLLQMERS